MCSVSEADGNKETESYSVHWILQHWKKKKIKWPTFFLKSCIDRNQPNPFQLQGFTSFRRLQCTLSFFGQLPGTTNVGEISLLSRPQTGHYKIFKYTATQNELVDTSPTLTSIITVSQVFFVIRHCRFLIGILHSTKRAGSTEWKYSPESLF